MHWFTLQLGKSITTIDYMHDVNYIRNWRIVGFIICKKSSYVFWRTTARVYSFESIIHRVIKNTHQPYNEWFIYNNLNNIMTSTFFYLTTLYMFLLFNKIPLTVSSNPSGRSVRSSWTIRWKHIQSACHYIVQLIIINPVMWHDLPLNLNIYIYIYIYIIYILYIYYIKRAYLTIYCNYNHTEAINYVNILRINIANVFVQTTW